MRTLVCLLTLLLLAPAAAAQSRKKQKKPAATPAAAKEPEKKKEKKDKVFDFTGFELSGSVRMPQLLYFLDRAEEELERASLERRSFIPEMVRSVDEGPL